MTLAKLEQMGVETPTRLAPRSSTSNTALAFAFDSGYLEPFRVMVYSMARAGTMLDSPIFVFSDDPAVFEDPVVALIADKIIPVDGELKDDLYFIAEHHVGRPERADWNRGTCLKWAVFAECDVDQLLFLDVDMLCLDAIDGLLDLHPDVHLVGAPQFPKSLRYDGKEAAEARLVLERLNGMISEQAKPFRGRLNSGVMLVRKPLLSAGFRERLLTYARTGIHVNEQSILTSFFREPRVASQYKLRLVSSAYNFHESYLGFIDPVDAFRLVDQIRILHYPGSPKPWRSAVTEDSRPSTLVWRTYRRSAAAYSGLFEDSLGAGVRG
jgi:lipopolysaccharide biosynthesis glycosyltransferase